MLLMTKLTVIGKEYLKRMEKRDDLGELINEKKLLIQLSSSSLIVGTLEEDDDVI